MKLTEGRSGANLLLIRGYSAEGVTVGPDRLALPVMLTPERVDTSFATPALEALTPDDIATVAAQGATIVLAGSAAGPRVAPAAVRRAFEQRGIALEAMDLGAACRTFNVLAQEERPVVALLFP